MNARRLAKTLVPGLVRLYGRMRVEASRRQFRKKSVAETFRDVYQTNWWGADEAGRFFSGHGSRNEFAARYAGLVTDFVRRHGVTSILDIGCGDFQVARLFELGPATSYLGMDVVPELIEHHASVYGRDNVHFVCRDAIQDELPNAELCLIRQVLQHLSNAQIQKILAKCRKYRYLLVTEDVYVGRDVRPNVDAPHGPNTRWAERSGVYLELPPFNLPSQVVLEVPAGHHAVLRSVLVENPNPLRRSDG